MLEEHRKAVVRGEIEKSGVADHLWKEKGNHLPLWNEVKIIGCEEHWRIRRYKESAHMLGYSDLVSRLYRDEFNMGTNNQKGLIEKIRYLNSGKKSYIKIVIIMM